MPISVLVADDQEVVRAGLVSMFKGTDIRIVGEAKSAEEAVSVALSRKPDVVLLEVQLGEDDGIVVAEKIRKKLPAVRVVIFSVYDNPRYISRAVEVGAVDYLVKGCSRQELVNAIKRAATDESLSPEDILQRFPRSKAKGRAPMENLTDRELQVVKHLALGLTNRDIGKSLGISVETVKEHVQNILRKIDGTVRTQVAVWAVKKGLV